MIGKMEGWRKASAWIIARFKSVTSISSPFSSGTSNIFTKTIFGPALNLIFPVFKFPVYSDKAAYIIREITGIERKRGRNL